MASTATANQEAEAPEESRKATMRRLISEGKSRREVADELGVTYQTVYSNTADMEVPNKGGAGQVGGGKARVILQVNGQDVPRSEWIREQSKAGKSRGEILKELKAMPGQENATFQIVYAATKPAGGSKAARNAAESDGETEDENLVDLGDEGEAVEGDQTLFP
jgi:transposase